MRFLVDNALSPSVAAGLNQAGHDAVHVRDACMAAAPDREVLGLALREKRVVVSADTDFGALLASCRAGGPSLVLFRGDVTRRPDRQLALLLANLPQLTDALAEGSVVVLEGTRVHIRRLPLV
jgi:predicted nuclease of predicted toxin-antitoxin system